MSGSPLVRNSDDLLRLVNDGYTVRIVHGYLVIDDIPYVDATQTVEWGSFLCPLDLGGEQTAKPSNHVMAFVGSAPCNKDGGEISPGFANPGLTYNWTAGPELTPSIGFSQKPRPEGYVDFHEKVTTYAAMLIGPAQAVDRDVTPLQGKPFTTDEGDGVFVYLDTFSSRAGITTRSKRLELAKVVIVGLGGTGAYILDLLAKTPICNIHLYDGDVFSTHNAFRAPGAAALDVLNARMKKVDYYARRRTQPCGATFIRTRLTQLRPTSRRCVMRTSSSWPWTLDRTSRSSSARSSPPVSRSSTPESVLSEDAEGIAGQVRVTTALPDANEHVVRGGLISIVAGDAGEYDTNLQVAELNMAAAFMAVVRFKNGSTSTPTARANFTVRIGSTPTRSSTSTSVPQGRRTSPATVPHEVAQARAHVRDVRASRTRGRPPLHLDGVRDGGPPLCVWLRHQDRYPALDRRLDAHLQRHRHHAAVGRQWSGAVPLALPDQRRQAPLAAAHRNRRNPGGHLPRSRGRGSSPRCPDPRGRVVPRENGASMATLNLAVMHGAALERMGRRRQPARCRDGHCRPTTPVTIGRPGITRAIGPSWTRDLLGRRCRRDQLVGSAEMRARSSYRTRLGRVESVHSGPMWAPWRRRKPVASPEWLDRAMGESDRPVACPADIRSTPWPSPVPPLHPRLGRREASSGSPLTGATPTKWQHRCRGASRRQQPWPSPPGGRHLPSAGRSYPDREGDQPPRNGSRFWAVGSGEAGIFSVRRSGSSGPMLSVHQSNQA